MGFYGGQKYDNRVLGRRTRLKDITPRCGRGRVPMQASDHASVNTPGTRLPVDGGAVDENVVGEEVAVSEVDLCLRREAAE